MRAAPGFRLSLLRSALFPIAALFFLVAIPSRSEDAPKLPDGVDPLPPELSLRLKDLLKNAEKYRGLKCLHGVPSGSLKEDALRVKMKLSFEEELPPAKMKPLDSALKSFGLIPETMDLGKFYPELLTSQVGGYYDPRRQYLVIVQREGGLLGKEATEKFGKDLARKMEETIMVHELTHAIQDQNFNLRKFMIDDPLSDAGAARLALVEGDATLTMYNFLTGMKMEELPMIEDLIGKMVRNPEELMAMTPDMPGGKELAAAPAWFRDGILFTYMQGFVFCIKAKKAGGQALLDYAFTKDPPRSTEQILHPEKWLGQRDDPIEITLPDLSAKLNGWTKISEGTLGEMGIKVWLNETLKDNEKSAKAAEGWGGDRFTVYEKDGARFLGWVSDWDTAEDAAKFKSACAALNNKEWTVVAGSEKRVTLVRATLDAQQIAALHQTLNTAKASVPENKRIDIVAVKGSGAKAPDATATGEPVKPGGKEGELDLDTLLKNPEVAKAIKEMGGGQGGLDVAELMKNPMFKEMMNKMLSSKSTAGVVSKDGRQYSNAEAGFTMKLPESVKSWKLDGKPSIPMMIALVESPDGSGRVAIASQELPMALPIESMGPMMEMGFKIAMHDYKKIKEGVIGEGDSKGYEFEYSNTQAGERIHMLSRFYIRGSKLLMINAASNDAEWQKNEKAIADILSGIKLSAPKPTE